MDFQNKTAEQITLPDGTAQPALRFGGSAEPFRFEGGPDMDVAVGGIDRVKVLDQGEELLRVTPEGQVLLPDGSVPTREDLEYAIVALARRGPRL